VIVRVLTLRVATRSAARVERELRDDLRAMSGQSGLLHVRVARQRQDGHETLMVFQDWADANGLYGWIGNDARQLRVGAREGSRPRRRPQHPAL
jgi:heme-degrading monooxygenase HmoA